MNYFVFNGVSSERYGIIVNKLPYFEQSCSKYSEIKIDGKDGAKYVHNGYDSSQRSITITLMDDTMINNVSAWLVGEGTISFSNDPTMFYYCIFTNPIKFSNKTYTTEIQFKVQPFKYSILEFSSTSRLWYGGTVYGVPKIKIVGSGTVVLLSNNHQICTLDVDTEITIDSSEQEVYDKNGSLANRRMSGDFPLLEPRTVYEFTTQGSVSSIEIIWNTRYM